MLHLDRVVCLLAYGYDQDMLGLLLFLLSFHYITSLVFVLYPPLIPYKLFFSYILEQKQYDIHIYILNVMYFLFHILKFFYLP